MTGLTGRRLGVYHLQTLLGAGGMGEVYRARDTRLGRDVAIKILPPVFIADPDRLARFEREARVLASLNHPNIGAIYGLEEADGLRGLVLELVDGETLAERIRRPEGLRLPASGSGRPSGLPVAEGRIDRPHASPDDRWLAFRRIVGTTAKTYVGALSAGRARSSGQWQEVPEPTVTGRPTGWSLDSQVLYLLLDTDGFRCLWGQGIDPASGRVTGAPVPVRHFHDEYETSGGGPSTSYGNPFTSQGFVYETLSISGNLWRLSPSAPPR